LAFFRNLRTRLRPPLAWLLPPLTPIILLALAPALVSAQMMDPKQVAGIPLPVGDVPTGTVTIRVIRGSLTNNIADQSVQLMVDNVAQEAKTGPTGRAEFTGLRPGARVKAVAVVGDERLESQEFPIPSQGGVRVLLVASDSATSGKTSSPSALSAPAVEGTVALGDQTRFVFELADASINVFNILQIVNNGATPVSTREPVVFDAPPEASNVSLLNGSTPRAVANGRRVAVAGPFPPGPTLVQFAYSLPYSGANVTLDQRLPIGLSQLTIMAQKVGDMTLSSPLIGQRREVAAQGETYIVAQGSGLKAGDTLSVSFGGLPHAPTWPRNLALALAAGILGIGAWAGFRPTGKTPAANRAELEARRDRLFSELTALERQQRAAAIDPLRGDGASTRRRRQLMSELESVYAALDS
jgi:hypothetical protein